jgi:hypothetical protein
MPWTVEAETEGQRVESCDHADTTEPLNGLVSISTCTEWGKTGRRGSGQELRPCGSSPNSTVRDGQTGAVLPGWPPPQPLQRPNLRGVPRGVPPAHSCPACPGCPAQRSQFGFTTTAGIPPTGFEPPPTGASESSSLSQERQAGSPPPAESADRLGPRLGWGCGGAGRDLAFPA